MQFWVNWVGLILFIADGVLGSTVNVFPSLLLSYGLIPGLRSSIDHSSQMPYQKAEAETIIGRAFEQCLSHAYIIADIPGLVLSDFAHFEAFQTLRKQAAAASTIISMPNVLTDDLGNTLDMDKIENILKVNCDVKVMDVKGNDKNSMEKYIDTQRRLIRISFPALNSNSTLDARLARLKEYDEVIKEVFRILPTPNIVTLFTTNTSTTVDLDEISNTENVIEESEIPESPKMISLSIQKKMKQSKRMIFPDITIFDKSRYYDYERNSNTNQDVYVRKKTPKNDKSWLSRKKKVIKKKSSLYRFGEDDKELSSVFINVKFIHDNALLIFCVISVLGLIIFGDMIRIALGFVTGALSKHTKSESKSTGKREKQD